jgi:hypothetical protein
VKIKESPASPAAYPSRERKVLHSENKKSEPLQKAEQSLPASQALLVGNIREINSFPPEQLGMPSGKNIYRLIIQVESTNSVKGGPNFLKEKEGELLTVFSEINPPVFRPGQKITAIVEYRGNRLSQYYWVQKPQAVNP